MSDFPKASDPARAGSGSVTHLWDRVGHRTGAAIAGELRGIAIGLDTGTIANWVAANMLASLSRELYRKADPDGTP